ncbi:MAG TPA: hypothetical protein VFY44_08025, partial [Thermoleophilaceae bacterium]|nr:hypothetical protein [Thermoleophilaceae bacterium]
MAVAATVTEQDAAFARDVGAEAARQIRAIARPGTVIALPTVPCAPPRIDAGPDEVESFRARTLRLTCIAGLSGLPQVTVPAGLSLIGWPGGDESLLEVAAELTG